MIQKICEVCQQEFSVKKYRENSARFCSHSCGGKWHMMNRVMRGPSLVGNKYRLGLNPSNAFKPGENKGKKLVERVHLNCLNCSKEFEVMPWIYKQNKTKFCSISCRSEYWIGEKHPMYKGGPTTYRGKSWTKQRMLAVNRDNGTCVHCKKEIGKSIPVHHIIPYRDYECSETANQLSNLICLCQSCHMKAEPRKILTERQLPFG
jgi:hypothetical protein